MRRKVELDPTGCLKNCYIAGGAVLSVATKTDINDYDIYPKTKEAAFDIIANLIDDPDGYVVNVTDRAVTIKRNDVEDSDGKRAIFQVIVGEFPTTESIFDCFDFTVCMGAYDCDTKEFQYDERFWEDVASKTLTFHMGTLYPLNSLFRIAKYRHKGYHITKAETAKIAIRLMQDGLPKSWEEFENQLGGVYGRSMSLSRKDKEFSIEALLEILDEGMNIEYIDGDKYSSWKIEDIELFYCDDLSDYRVLTLEESSSFPCASRVILKRVEGEEGVFRIEKILNPNSDIVEKLEEAKPDDVIVGYKGLIEIDGLLYPSIRKTSSEVTYKLSAETRQDEAKSGHYLYMFISPKESYDKKTETYNATTKVKDLVGVIGNEIKTKAITIGEKYE